MLSEVECRVVGKRRIHPGRVDKVTGRAQYGAEVNLTGLSHGKVSRSPDALARIKSIDISRATGVRMGSLPMAPGKILDALWGKGDGAGGTKI